MVALTFVGRKVIPRFKKQILAISGAGLGASPAAAPGTQPLLLGGPSPRLQPHRVVQAWGALGVLGEMAQ